MWSTGRMADMHLVGTNGQIDFTLDGVTFRRTKAAAEARGVERLHSVGWSEIEAASVVRSGNGKPVIRIEVAGAPVIAHRRNDPHAMKLKRGMGTQAREFVALVNHEVATPRRW